MPSACTVPEAVCSENDHLFPYPEAAAQRKFRRRIDKNGGRAGAVLVGEEESAGIIEIIVPSIDVGDVLCARRDR